MQKEQEKNSHLNNQLIKLNNNIKGITDFDNLQKEIEDNYKKSKDVLEDKNNNEENSIINNLKEKIKTCLQFEKLYNQEKIKYNDLDTKCTSQSNKIDELNTKIKNLELSAANNKNINEELTNKSNEIEKLKKEIKEKDDKIKEINVQNQKISDENKIKFANLEKKIEENKTQMNEQKKNFESSNEEIKKLAEKNDDLIKKNINEIKNSLINERINNDMNERFKELYNFIIYNFINLNKSLTHNRIKCEKCFDEPIRGYRYKCTICNDYNLCEKCEEKNLISEEHPHYFIKIRNEYKEGDEITDNIPDIINDNPNNNDNNINSINIINDNENDINDSNKDREIKKEYSYDCLNQTKLTNYIYEGTDEAKIEIILKNNGKEDWPKDCTKLIFDETSKIKGDEIVLKPQKSNEQQNYHVILKNVSNLPVGEYKSYLLFCVNDETFGENLELTVGIKEKKKKKSEIDENIDKINEFRQNYSLDKNDHSDAKILKALKKNDFDFDAAFSSLFD